MDYRVTVTGRNGGVIFEGADVPVEVDEITGEILIPGQDFGVGHWRKVVIEVID